MNASRTQSALLASIGLAALLGGIFLKTAQAQPTPTGKITPWAAIRIAQAKVPGRALQANFEFDEGKWVYGVMIVSGKTIKEVEIDPTTGKVGDVETVTPAGEAKEMQAMLTKAVGGKAAASPAASEQDEKGEKPE